MSPIQYSTALKPFLSQFPIQSAALSQSILVSQESVNSTGLSLTQRTTTSLSSVRMLQERLVICLLCVCLSVSVSLCSIVTYRYHTQSLTMQLKALFQHRSFSLLVQSLSPHSLYYRNTKSLSTRLIPLMCHRIKDLEILDTLLENLS